MRIAGILLLVLAALVVAPSLTIAAWVTWTGWDEQGLQRLLCYAVAILGACIGGIGVLAVWVGRKREPRSSYLD